MALIKFSTPPTWRGFSFILHLLRVQGFYFLSGNVSATHKRLQWLFCRPCNYTTKTSKAFTGLYSGFPVDLPYSSAPQHRTLYRAEQPPIIIKYIRGRRCIDLCQAIQHSADHASPAGSAPTVCGPLASADSVSAVQTRCTC